MMHAADIAQRRAARLEYRRLMQQDEAVRKLVRAHLYERCGIRAYEDSRLTTTDRELLSGNFRRTQHAEAIALAEIKHNMCDIQAHGYDVYLVAENILAEM